MNKYIIITILLLTFFPYAVNGKNYKIHSSNNIARWFGDNYIYSIKSVDNNSVTEVFLRNKEMAFLFEVRKVTAGRGFSEESSVIMVRPTKKQARELAERGEFCFFDKIKSIYDFDHDGVSEVELSGFALMNGTSEDHYYLAQFNGFEPIILHQADFYNNLGCCGPGGDCGECKVQNVSWKFVDLDGDGVDDLVEEVVTKQGPSEDKLTETKTTTSYLFKNKKFIKVDDASKLHLPQ